MHVSNCSVTTEVFQNTLLSPGVRATAAIFLAISLLTLIIGVPGNGLVIWVLGLRLKLTETTLLFLNLAVADFFYLFLVPFRVAYAALHFDWPFGSFLCKADFFLAFVNMYASIFFLTSVSIDRCLLVAWPMWYRRHRSMEASSAVCVLVWLMSIALSAPYLFFADNETLFNHSICFINYAPEEIEPGTHGLRKWREPTMIMVRFVSAFCIPVVVIVSCYVRIGRQLLRMRLKNQTKVYRITLLTVLAFFINWTPYQLFSIASLLSYAEPGCLFHPSVFVGYPVVYAFAYVNSCVNPILYVFVGGGFSHKLHQSLAAVFEKAFKEDTLSGTQRRTRKSPATLRKGSTMPSLSQNVNTVNNEEQ